MDGFIPFHSPALWVIRARPGCRRILLGTLRVSFGSFIRGLALLGFIRARPGGLLVYSGSLGSFGSALGVVGSFRVGTGSLRVHSSAS